LLHFDASLTTKTVSEVFDGVLCALTSKHKYEITFINWRIFMHVITTLLFVEHDKAFCDRIATKVVDFDCCLNIYDREYNKLGRIYAMKLVSWNVNGLRACLKKGFLESFAEIGADVFCLQETKMEQGQAEIELGGYQEFWNSAEKKGYSGTAIFTKIPPLSVSYGMGVEEHDQEGRIITLEFEDFYLVCVYVPNSKRELLRLDYRMVWEDAFRAYVGGLDKLKPVLICGDLNVAHEEIDLKNPKSNRRNAGFTDEERAKMTELLSSGFTDFFRQRNPDLRDAYTWWSYMGKARDKNVGWRIDYFLGSSRLSDRVSDVFILPDVQGSDHCPVGIVID